MVVFNIWCLLCSVVNKIWIYKILVFSELFFFFSVFVKHKSEVQSLFVLNLNITNDLNIKGFIFLIKVFLKIISHI